MDMEAKITNRISIILDIKGWTQTKLAQKAEIDESHLSRIINGNAPSLRNAFKICQALDVPIDKVFKFEEDRAA